MDLHRDRAIPPRLIAHLFTKLPPSDAEAAINRVIDAALPGPVAWYRGHVREEMGRVRRILLGEAETGDCGCMPDSPAPTCDVGQALFRVSANHLARRAA